MGIFTTLLTGLFFAGSGVRAGLENEKLKSELYTLPNGMQYYYDRQGIMHLLNGTPITLRDERDRTVRVIHLTTGKTLYDGRLRIQKYLWRKNEEIRKKYEGNRYIYQYFPMGVEKAVLDIEENKIVLGVHMIDDEYFKYYDNGYCTNCQKCAHTGLDERGFSAYECIRCPHRGDVDLFFQTYYCTKNEYYCSPNNSPAIKISKEEYEMINNAPGREEIDEFLKEWPEFTYSWNMLGYGI